MILSAYDDYLAMQVFERLDPYDLLEAKVIRGQENLTHLQLFAEWRVAAMGSVLALVLRDDTRSAHPPFAVMNLAHTGNYGVAQAALLARNHSTFRRQMVRAAKTIRETMPDQAKEMGIRRIEARSWSGHPTANNFLIHCGFTCEAEKMPGFGAHGNEACNQFAWTI